MRDWRETLTSRFARPTFAGRYVNRMIAMRNPAVHASVRYIATSIAKMPGRVMRARASGAGADRAADHPVDTLLSRAPLQEMGPFQLKETLVADALLEGNGYAEIVTTELTGVPIALERIAPGRVDLKRDREGRLYYHVVNPDGGAARISPERMFHLRGLGSGLLGLSVIEYAAETIGWADATQVFSARFFGHGLSPSGFIETDGSLSPAAQDELLNEIEETMAGAANAWKPVLLDKGMKWQAWSLSPEQGQFVETRKLQIEEISRWFGVPLHIINHLERATFSNIEHQSIEAVVNCLMPWVTRFEEEADRKLLQPPFFCKLNEKALLRGDSDSRAKLYDVMARHGALPPNDMRALEDMNPFEGFGDEPLVLEQMVPLRLVSALQSLQDRKPAPAQSTPSGSR